VDLAAAAARESAAAELEDQVIEKLELQHQHHHKVMMVDLHREVLLILVMKAVAAAAGLDLLELLLPLLALELLVEMGLHPLFREHQ
jgi:hypothetical protein